MVANQIRRWKAATVEAYDTPIMLVFSKTRGLLLLLFLILATSSLCDAKDKKKISYGILVDNTGSMRTQFETVKEFGKGVVHQVHDRGPVSIFDFASERVGTPSRAIPTLRIERTQDEALLNRTIDKLYVEGGQTTLLDAIEFIAERLHQQSDDSDKVIVLITDGEERSSQVKRKQLVQQLKDWKVKIFAVGLVEELDNERSLTSPSPRAKAIDLLKLIAKETEGRAVFPTSSRVNFQSLLAELAIPI